MTANQAPPISEAAFQRTVIAMAKALGWLCHAERPAIRQSGKWSTPIQGDKGFPDLVLARDGKFIIAELKSDKGRLSAYQELWIATLGGLGEAHHMSNLVGVYVWRPSMMDAIERILKGEVEN